jgi:hypothetical protein
MGSNHVTKGSSLSMPVTITEDFEDITPADMGVVHTPPVEILFDGETYDKEMEERLEFTYTEITEGGTKYCIAARVRAQFSVSMETALQDYDRAIARIHREQTEARDKMLVQLQAIRLTTIRKAFKRGQLQTVAMLCKDLGAVLGETAPEQIALQVPELTVNVQAVQDPPKQLSE